MNELFRLIAKVEESVELTRMVIRESAAGEEVKISRSTAMLFVHTQEKISQALMEIAMKMKELDEAKGGARGRR